MTIVTILATDTLIVTVTDDTEPVAICDRRTVVSLNQNGTVWVQLKYLMMVHLMSVIYIILR
jgi:hypothetical protein